MFHQFFSDITYGPGEQKLKLSGKNKRQNGSPGTFTVLDISDWT